MFTENINRRDFAKQTAAAAFLLGLPAFSGGCSKNPAKDVAAKILIIGGGAAGITVAARLRRKLGKAEITIVDPAEKHFYQPGFTFIGAGIWKADDVWMPEEKLIPSGVKWIRDRVVEVDAAHNSAMLKGGGKLQYDFLVLCPGLQENWSLVQGITKETLGEGNAHSIYDWQGSCRTWTAVDRFARTGGRGIFTDTWTKHKCGGAPKKICLLTEQLARRHGKRDACSFKYFTASKQLYDVPHYTPRLEKIYAERGIPVSVRCRLTGVDTSAKRAYFLNSETHKSPTRLSGSLVIKCAS
jgi:sulfide:quinone oxidoreductase